MTQNSYKQGRINHLVGPYALHNTGAPLESSTPKRERGVGRDVPTPTN